ncbi:MAG: SAM-dependent methyltransferase [Spirochaetia bacterium]|nr:SAM-dependent methyltransferase [Spirochaetia bacterium]
MSGILYLLPVPIADGDPKDELAPKVIRAIQGIRDFIVENERSARRVLSKILPQESLDASRFFLLDEHTPLDDVPALLAPLLSGRDAAIMSEAGSPCVADPGATLVAAAFRADIQTIPLAGPSAILMAIMASGLGGQHFSFKGYLPQDASGREAALRDMEQRSAKEGSTQAFIETPYRNDAVALSAAKALKADTIFCAAIGLSTPRERILRMSAMEWRKSPPTIGKIPTVFLLLAHKEASPRPEQGARRGQGTTNATPGPSSRKRRA